MSNYSRFIRPFFFRLDPENAHQLTVRALRLAQSTPLGLSLLAGLFDYHHPKLETELFGLCFRNPVGLAAGYDKEAMVVRPLAALGFGHIEVGTITPRPQDGNPRPRIFRLPEDQAVINRMGFPNQGSEVLLERIKLLRRRPVDTLVGVNIGKGKTTPLDKAVDDYTCLLRKFHPYADFFGVNISSPNTPDLRKLQAKKALAELMGGLVQVWRETCPQIPLLVKIAPDLTWEEIDDVLEVVADLQISGIIAANTTIGREGLTCRRPVVNETGGLSGAPVRQRSTEIIRYIYRQTKGALPIIGVGGVDSVDAALEKMRAGASLVQVYTGMIFQGPTLVKNINEGLDRRMAELGVSGPAELVGQDVG